MYLADKKRSLLTLLIGCVLTGVFTTGLVLSGCSTATEGTLPPSLEDRLASNGNADDHMAAALLYQGRARELLAQARKYEQEFEAIDPIEDPKGFKRQSLRLAAETARTKANKMLQLYAEHRTQALTMTGQHEVE